MSLGYTGMCKKVAEDECLVIYSYAGENWNDGVKSKSGDCQLQDGMFTIHKDDFCEDIERCIQIGIIKIDRECKNAFCKSGVPCDYIAWRLLRRLYIAYEQNGLFSETATFIQ